VKKQLGFLLTAWLLASGAACSNNRQGEAMKPNDQPAPKFDLRNMLPKSLCPSQRLPFVKLKDNLVLQIPEGYGGVWSDHCDLGLYDIKNLDKIPYAESAGFGFHMPDFKPLSAIPNNTGVPFASSVQVFDIYVEPMNQMEQGAPGKYPPNMFERIQAGAYPSIDPKKYEEVYGLRCYEKLDKTTDNQICYGIRTSGLGFDEYILLNIKTPPFQQITVYPIMQAVYFTPKYGGIEIGWRTHMDNFPKWREIDAHIWKLIDEWNIAPKPSAALPAN
jgi:hypothetical protein